MSSYQFWDQAPNKKILKVSFPAHRFIIALSLHYHNIKSSFRRCECLPEFKGTQTLLRVYIRLPDVPNVSQKGDIKEGECTEACRVENGLTNHTAC